MSAPKSQSSLFRFGFGLPEDTVAGLVDPKLSAFGPKSAPVAKRGLGRPRKNAQPDNDINASVSSVSSGVVEDYKQKL